MEENENLPSVFTSKVSIGVFFVAAAVFLYIGFFYICAFLVFMGIFCLLARIWGKSQIKNIYINIDCRSKRLFAGESFDVTFEVENRKILPLAWLEVYFKIPEKVCVKPTENFVSKKKKDLETMEVFTADSIKFTWILPFQKIKIKTKFEACRRGVYIMDDVYFATGDGFGLSVCEKKHKTENPPVFMVYPQIKDINDSVFVVYSMEQNNVGDGIYEDNSLIRSVTAYDGRQSFKKINWRMLARGEGFNLNVYDKLSPEACFFVIDRNSFLNEDGETFEESFEKAVSVVASAAVCLDGKVMYGMAVGGGKTSQQYVVMPQKETLETIMTRLCYIEAEKEVYDLDFFRENKELLGRVYIISRSKDSFSLYDIEEILQNRFVKRIYTESEADDNSFGLNDIWEE